ncbi:hypothetical protein COLO4_32519 [Corchorus olitorius]|uniref:Epidermal patterning factor-like protein n=1 Tax=Corchorus olitorius TaxID=93759 RepID=A0A1R3GZG7_9ROSI|nr:hypothetical protein COLO4_32519 [Corchorus olitorius]
MEQRLKSTNFIISLLLTILISSSSLVHSRKLVGSPPPPSLESRELVNGRMRKPGSFPAACHWKCNKCKPCIPVQVSIRTVDYLQENEYYPQVWQCKCQDNIYPP